MNEKNEFVLIVISMIVFSAGTIAMGLIKIVIIFLGLEAIQGIFVLAFVFVVIYSFRKMQIKAQPDKNPKRFYLSRYYQRHR